MNEEVAHCSFDIRIHLKVTGICSETDLQHPKNFRPWNWHLDLRNQLRNLKINSEACHYAAMFL